MNGIESVLPFAVVFPGQGSQRVGMMSTLAAVHDEVVERFATASRVLGFDLWDLISNGPADSLNRTENTQPAMLAAGVATWDVWLKSGGPMPARVAGHSFGEYTALVCAGALEFDTAVALAADRGRYMQEAVPEHEGAMAAILGLELGVLEAICERAAGDQGICACANHNAPGQIVIAGDTRTVEAACEIAREAGAKRAIRLPMSVPVHCSLMRPAAERLAERLRSVEFTSPRIEVTHNVDVATHSEPEKIKDALVRQLYSPVRWIETIEDFAHGGIFHVFECGPGNVLTSLIKRIDRSLDSVALSDSESIKNQVETISELARGRTDER
ncbi:MAG: ACP S-malonyltransferase [Pseudomonadota bacterium]|nr:ACP S-malonyltransferase [Pseudomonadota bacterium]